ncbi:hypothetical protein KQX54_013204 [Cotesia glomerata]|uniref:Uncharacterized protein n=1 Tax=Cotesia glomerata TaxID=32391 RepID=A0AAV7J3T9_COTGL|nr:hypothetical protein KQX54_013204 [Cotesia glomerata]
MPLSFFSLSSKTPSPTFAAIDVIVSRIGNIKRLIQRAVNSSSDPRKLSVFLFRVTRLNDVLPVEDWSEAERK